MVTQAPRGDPQAFERELLGEPIVCGAGVRQLLREQFAGTLRLANRQHGHTQIAQDIAFAGRVADLAGDRQRLFERRDRTLWIAVVQ